MAPSENSVVVAVRLRPLSSKERQRASHSCCVVQDARQINVIDPDEKMDGQDYLRLERTKDKSFAFDFAFDEHQGQTVIYEQTTKPVCCGPTSLGWARHPPDASWSERGVLP